MGIGFERALFDMTDRPTGSFCLLWPAAGTMVRKSRCRAEDREQPCQTNRREKSDDGSQTS